MPHFVAHDRILGLLAQGGIRFQIYVHEPVITLEQALERVPHLCENLLKTVVFRRGNGGWVLVAVEAQKRVHYKGLAEALGINRTALRAVAPTEVEQEVGFPVGGVGPFPLLGEATRVIIDREAAALERVFCGSGRPDRTLSLDMADLLRVSSAQVYPIAQEKINMP